MQLYMNKLKIVYIYTDYLHIITVLYFVPMIISMFFMCCQNAQEGLYNLFNVC